MYLFVRSLSFFFFYRVTRTFDESECFSHKEKIIILIKKYKITFKVFYYFINTNCYLWLFGFELMVNL